MNRYRWSAWCERNNLTDEPLAWGIFFACIVIIIVLVVMR